ncbi:MULTISPECIES: MarR family winged helix-turn-helix transcriptional regulator [Streptomyces]|uniref:MarR family winged helix-turn-helix transcriptional regulator n=1 Tax=Streptomyces TaxID=1883 RepID=UPI00067BD1C2|nr:MULTISPECIES: MarR family transcriptional regulator [Streptomyces]KOT47448.1 MarR family transcriptional regulator [Streptomyces rimosus subsp. rimosus]
MAGTDEPSGVDQVFLSLERELAVFLRRARATSGELARAVHPELESAAYGLLVRLADAGQQRATDLAGYFGVGKATMSRQLRALEDLGLIAREPDPADGRAVLVRLTDEGHDRFSCVRNSRRAQYARQLASWDRREVAELARLLHRLNGEQDAEEGCGAAPAAGKSERAGKGERGGDGGQGGDAGSAGNA